MTEGRQKKRVLFCLDITFCIFGYCNWTCWNVFKVIFFLNFRKKMCSRAELRVHPAKHIVSWFFRLERNWEEEVLLCCHNEFVCFFVENRQADNFFHFWKVRKIPEIFKDIRQRGEGDFGEKFRKIRHDLSLAFDVSDMIPHKKCFLFCCKMHLFRKSFFFRLALPPPPPN